MCILALVLVMEECFLLLLSGSPEIFTPENQDIEESFGETVDLSCQARGSPPLAITWSTIEGKVQQSMTDL